MLTSGDRVILKHQLLRFPVTGDKSSFLVIKRKLKLLEVNSPNVWKYRTNDNDNNRLSEDPDKNISTGYWRKIEEELPTEFYFKANTAIIYEGILDDDVKRIFDVDPNNNVFHVKKEISLLNYEVTNGEYKMVFSYEKLYFKIKEGKWIILDKDTVNR